jgi:DGQHR domain-containing protein
VGGREQSTIPALKVRQWLPSWDDLEYDDKAHRRHPDPYFFLAAMPASTLRALAGIRRRKAVRGEARQRELGIQRRHDEARSAEIREFVRNGFPWSQLSSQRRESGEFDDLRKPGWLPTSIVVNVLTSIDQRDGRKVAKADLITIDAEESHCQISLPKDFSHGDWTPNAIPPLEVIDGQHRLWAFESNAEEENFELPVVIFHGLDVSWQAYLFYSINITPKKINRSLAYDLYPLLRSENWLERFEGSPIYRETRSQELTEALWAHPQSPWHDRIDMLGDRGRKEVSQAAWIRSLMATFVKTHSGHHVRHIGGLFGAPAGEDRLALAWSSSQQAAFLIRAWEQLAEAIRARKEKWMISLRGNKKDKIAAGAKDPAFAGPLSLLNTDQGVRGFLHVVNDLCYFKADSLEFVKWESAADSPGISSDAIDADLKGLSKQSVDNFLGHLAEAAALFDWRTSTAPGLSESERREKARFRGSGGYKELRMELTEFLAEKATADVSKSARGVADLLFSE